MKYYYDLMSQPSRAIYIFLSQAKIPFTKCPIAIRKGEHKTPEYTKVHPFQKLPALDDGGFKLTESIAILRYLAAKYGDQIDDSWYPKDLKTRARVDEYMEWQHANTRFNCAMFFQHKLLIPLLTQSPPKEKSVARFQSQMEVNLQDFENFWLTRGNFIAGEKLSFADLLAICELQQPGVVGYDVIGDRPLLRAWFDRVKTSLEPSFSEASAIVAKFTDMYAKGQIPIPKAAL